MSGAKVFISYKHDHAASEALLSDIRKRLVELGYTVLVDEGMQGGDRWSSQLYAWLLDCAAAIVLASTEARNSDWCQREWHVLAARADGSRARVLPVCIDMDADQLGPLKSLQSLKADDDLLERIEDGLRGVVPSTISPVDFLALHRAWNRYQYERASVLGREPFSLADIYVDTECGALKWGEIAKGSALALDPFNEANGGRRSLLETVMDFILDATFRDAVVVQGPAGAGKSSFTLRLAAELETRGLYAVRLRFRDMRLALHDTVEEMLADAVRVGGEADEKPAPAAGLFDSARLRETIRIGDTALCKWIFILDGWDEVSLAGSAGYQAQLRTWLPRIREFFKPTGAPVRLVVTGRPSMELRESGFLYQDTPVLTLRPMRPAQLKHLAIALERKAEWVDLAKCDSICARYAEWFRDRQGGGVEMLGLPLLALLAFRTLSAWRDDPEALLSSPTALYAALIDETVAHAGKATSDRLDGTVQRGGEHLRHLLRRTAAMISLSWSERISFEELQARLEESGDLQQWVDIAARDNALHELVVNFYFKGGHPDLGCEFLHKSFREYLFAEAIVETLESLAGEGAQRLKPPALEYWRDFPTDSIWHKASREISKLFVSSNFTPEVSRHAAWLIERAIRANPGRWVLLRDLLADVYGWWAEGVHLRLQPSRDRGRTNWNAPYIVELANWALPFRASDAEPQRTASTDAFVGFALVHLTAWVHSFLLDRNELPGIERPYQRRTPEGVRFCPGNGFLQYIMKRWGVVFMPFLITYEWPDVWLDGEWIPINDFAGANLRGAVLRGAFLRRGDLTGATLSGADMSHVHLAGARLKGARMDGADLREADLSGAYLGKASLKGANLFKADLQHAILTDADLSDADFTSAVLAGANFRRTDRRGAVFTGADTSGALMEGPAGQHEVG